ncbi:MAG: agmatinase [Nitrososphaerota archaeon]|nr:agmatinase [Candidatus Bathyarchaeota archaeon]MDW8048182.1 agmatinase [Nitrososphaerota archaeon]
MREASYIDLFTSQVGVFGGIQKPREEADYIIIGVPLDLTGSFRRGTAFAPLTIREASKSLELYSIRTGISIEDLKVHDAGDFHVTGDLEETLANLEKTTREILGQSDIPVLIGGEHTLALGAVAGIPERFGLVYFDAHMDARNEYMNRRLSHATVLRRICEEIKPEKIVQVGVRAASKDEIKYAESQGITYITTHSILKNGVEQAAKTVNRELDECNSLYITIDMDVLDPSIAPAVQNPEPEGLTSYALLELMHKVCGKDVIGFDLVEVSPVYDSGGTAITAAKIIFETMSFVQASRNS